MFQITEEILNSNKETITQLEQRGRENLAAITSLQKTIDAQLLYIQELKSIVNPSSTSLPQLIVSNATPGTSFTLHNITIPTFMAIMNSLPSQFTAKKVLTDYNYIDAPGDDGHHGHSAHLYVKSYLQQEKEAKRATE